MVAFSIFEDSPTRPASSAFTFRSQTGLLLNHTATTPNVDKENVNPLTCASAATRSGKKVKRKYTREEGAGPLSMKKKVKVAITGSGSSPVKKAEKKRRVLGGVGNVTLAPRPLVHEDTVILEELTGAVNRRAVELTVSPLADASEAYLSTPGSSIRTSPSLRDVRHSNSAYIEEDGNSSSGITDSQSYFASSKSSQATTSTHAKLSPLLQTRALGDPSTFAIEACDLEGMMEDICLQIPLPPSP